MTAEALSKRKQPNAPAEPSSQEEIDQQALDQLEIERTKHIKGYARADNPTAWRQLLITMAIYVVGLVGTSDAIVPRPFNLLFFALFTFNLLRMFMIFHDCGHLAYFEEPSLNRATGYFLSMFVMTPYLRWQFRHNDHHNVFGNIDELDTGQTILFTKKEYESWPWYMRYPARVLREPLVFFAILPVFVWYLELPFRYGDRYTTLGYVIYILLGYFYNPLMFFSIYFSGILGVILFHLQHSVNAGYRCRTAVHDPRKAAVHGSTYMPLPAPFNFFTFAIEYHHIHHYSTRVPCYRLTDCHYGAPKGMWDDVTVVGFKKAMLSLLNVMWDEDAGKFVPFYPIST